MKTDYIVIYNGPNEPMSFNDILDQSLTDLENVDCFFLLQTCNTLEKNIRFGYPISDGFFLTNLILELPDKFLYPILMDLEKLGYKLDLKETETDIYNKAIEL